MKNHVMLPGIEVPRHFVVGCLNVDGSWPGNVTAVGVYF